MKPPLKPSLPQMGAPRRRAIDVSGEALVKMGTFAPDQPLPLVVEPLMGSDLDLTAWVRNNLELVERKLLEHGAVLFRGFGMSDVSGFEDFARVVAPELANYVEGSSPRIMLGDKVYTSTEYPPEYFVSLHNELSYAHRWPGKLLFFCAIEPREGGETPIADSRKVLQRLSPELRERFIQKKVKYVRNLHGDRGAGLSWQTVFETEDRSRVEEYCREGEIEIAWKENGGLWTSQVREAVATHPRTGEQVWFNQVDQWHPSNLGEELARALTATTREEDLPINAYHGDGSPLSVADLEEVRQAYRDVMVAFPWRQGDVLVVDNMLVAHGRMPFTPPRRVMVAMGDGPAPRDAR
ncbi:MAG TPA: TauD/TfdA family dioxygenase [Thermoanaerobaculia bacterium]|nr:TauD/TfdA family dioxygenase [Thermoanaerobaculia bacterium]